MKGLNALLGWLLMLAVLAVPSFLFYNWWTKNKTQSAGETAMATSVKDVFSAADQHTAVAAQAPGVAAAAVSSVSAIPARAAAPAAAVSPVPAAAPAAAARPAAVPAAQQKLPGPSAAPQTALAAAVSTHTAKGSFYSPKRDRNPMLSPEDYQRMKEEELRRAEEARAARLNRSRRMKEAGIETKIRLQGIVGNAAIINGEMFTAGQTVYGGKIVKIGVDYIIGEYKGKKFRIGLK